MFRLAFFLGLLGLAVATAVIAWSGFSDVLQALAVAGWGGIAAVAAFHIIPLVVSSAGWRALVPGRKRLSLFRFVYFMWIRAAINDFMPVARVGGEIASVRLMMAHGMRKSAAVAVTVGELTLSTVALLLFVSAGVFLFALKVNDANAITQMVWGVFLSVPLLGVLVVVQRIGFFGLLSKIFRLAFRDKWGALINDAARLDRAVATVYRRRKQALLCAFLQLASWGLGAGEVWLSLYFLGHPVSLVEALMLEALIQGAVSAAFAVPAALGVQEAGFVIFGGMLGIPNEISAAVAVIRRCRDLFYNTPALVAWQVHEGKRFLGS